MSTLSDLANEVQKAVYGKDLRRTVANFFEYVPRVRSGSYGSLAQYISNIRSAPLYKGSGTTIIGVQQQIANAVLAIGSALSNATIQNQSVTISSAAIGKPTKTAIVAAINLIVSAIDSSTFSISISGSNYTSDNSARTISSGSRYVNHLTASSGWKFQSVSVTMGGSPVQATVTDGAATIDISSVTGNITITVTTVQDQPGPTPTEKTETITMTLTEAIPKNSPSYTPLEISFSNIAGSDLKYVVIATTAAAAVVAQIRSITLQKENGVWRAISCTPMISSVEPNKNISIVSTASGFKTQYIGSDESTTNLGLGVMRASSGNRGAVLGPHTYTITGYNYIPTT